MEEKLDAFRGETRNALHSIGGRLNAAERDLDALKHWRTAESTRDGVRAWQPILWRTIATGVAVTVGGALALRLLGLVG